MSKSTAIAFQGSLGAYSDLSCRTVFPERQTMPCATFEDVFAAVHEGTAEYGMIPVENSVAGRVADNHHLLPQGGLHIIGEHYQRVNHQLLAPPGATLDTIKVVRSHIQALSQCRKAATDDLTAAVGLLDLRLLAGDEEVVTAVRAALAHDWRANARKRLPELVESAQARHMRFGDLAQSLDPDLKEARGGFRDNKGRTP